MSVDPGITRDIMAEELKSMAELASSYGWDVRSDLANLKVTVRMKSRIDGQLYVVEARCDEYKELPPYFEFLHPETGQPGAAACYPAGSNYFHPMPCICVQWNRKAYHDQGGPHGDWNKPDWMSARPGTTSLGDMFNLIQHEINREGVYRGRMGQA